MDYIIREMRSEEYCLLSDFLYEAIYIPEGIEPPPKSVIECPELQEYIVEFGNRKHDKALVAEIQGNVVGAIWVRIMNDYGHIDNDTPSLAMSVCPQYRGLGIGTSLLKQLLQVERLAGYSKISLSVQKSNYAVKMYEKVGFTVVNENSEEFITVSYTHLPPAETPEPEKEKPAGLNPAAIVLLLALLGGGGVFAYMKLMKNKPKTKGNDSLDDYDYGEEDSEEWETEDEESDELDADGGSTEEDDEDSVK